MQTLRGLNHNDSSGSLPNPSLLALCTDQIRLHVLFINLLITPTSVPQVSSHVVSLAPTISLLKAWCNGQEDGDWPQIV